MTAPKFNQLAGTTCKREMIAVEQIETKLIDSKPLFQSNRGLGYLSESTGIQFENSDR